MRINFCLLVLIFSNVSTKANVEDKTDLKIVATQLQSDSNSQKVILNQIPISEGHSRQKRANKRKNRNRNRNRNIIASVNVQNRGRAGTDLSAKAGGTVWQSHNGRSSLNANAIYDQHFGRGKSRPNFGASIKFTHHF